MIRHVALLSDDPDSYVPFSSRRIIRDYRQNRYAPVSPLARGGPSRGSGACVAHKFNIGLALERDSFPTFMLET